MLTITNLPFLISLTKKRLCQYLTVFVLKYNLKYMQNLFVSVAGRVISSEEGNIIISDGGSATSGANSSIDAVAGNGDSDVCRLLN